MLEYSARDYVKVSHQFGLLLGASRKDSSSAGRPDPVEIGNAINKLVESAAALGLVVTCENLGRMLREFVRVDPTKASLKDGFLHVKEGALDMGRFCHHIEAVYSTLETELGALLFKAIPRERVRFNNSKWLEGSAIEVKFPIAFRELERSGMCYSLGQPTASVFHAMRALEPALAALASPFGVSSAHENWQNIIIEIESKVRALGGQPKSGIKIEDEKFFGAAVSHLYFVKNAWRNHVVHTRDSYSDDEAAKIMGHSHEFIESLCPRLQET
jgi:hypothetical protein